MPVKVRITLYFTIIVFIILTAVCLSIYYISYKTRERNFQTRLTNRAVTTARLLSQSDIFNQALMQKIDASTSVAMLDKSIQAYDYSGNMIYYYADRPDDTIAVSSKVLNDARKNNFVKFTVNNKDAVAYHFIDDNHPVIIITAAYDPEGRQNLKALRLILWGCFIAGIIVTVGVGYFFSQRLLQPVKKIADDINAISAQNLAKRIKYERRNDEWNYLAQTLNALLNKLEESFDTQGRFIANASHELSTPLTAIFSQLEVSLQKDRDASEYRKVMGSVLDDVQQLIRLTQTLLQFAQASGRAGGLETQLVRIDEVLLRMPHEMTKAEPTYQVKMNFGELPTEEENLLVLANETLLFSAIKNIVQNACKYSFDQTAFITLDIKNNQVHIAIYNKGQQIPAEYLHHIFEPFFRVDATRAEKGFGLGLPLAKKIVQLHKGEITVSSSKDGGSTFTIILPAALSGMR